MEELALRRFFKDLLSLFVVGCLYGVRIGGFDM